MVLLGNGAGDEKIAPGVVDSPRGVGKKQKQEQQTVLPRGARSGTRDGC
jgi:hypothetical protein